MKTFIVTAIIIVGILYFATMKANKIIVESQQVLYEAISVGKIEERFEAPKPLITESKPTQPTKEVTVEQAPVTKPSRREEAYNSMLMEANRVKKNKELTGDVEPWNGGEVPKVRDCDRVYSKAGKNKDGPFSYHIVVRPEDDVQYARAYEHWLDMCIEDPKEKK